MILAAVVAFQVATYTLPPVELPQYVSEEPEIVWYPVVGSTIRDLRAQMRLNGPHDDVGAYAGYTHSRTHWHLIWHEAGGACAITNIAVTVYDTVTLPVWAPPSHADSAVVAEWSRFLTMLGRHEAGHRDIALTGAGEIARALAMLSPQASCADLESAANAQGQAILASVRAQQKQYDAETQHGLLRGTALEDLDPPAVPRLPNILVVVTVVALVFAIVWLVRSRAR